MAEDGRSKNSYFFKVCVCGEWGIGKSSIIVRYVEGSYEEGSITKTKEFEYKVKLFEREGKSIKLRICDSIGEERFSALTASFFRGTNAVVFVFDVTNKESADNLERWYGEVNRYVEFGNTPKVIAANKWDLEGVNPQMTQQTMQIAEKLASTWNCSLIKCSAKLDSNIEQLFDSLLPQAIAKADSNPGINRGEQSSSSDTLPKVEKKKSKCSIL